MNYVDKTEVLSLFKIRLSCSFIGFLVAIPALIECKIHNCFQINVTVKSDTQEKEEKNLTELLNEIIYMFVYLFTIEKPEIQNHFWTQRKNKILKI